MAIALNCNATFVTAPIPVSSSRPTSPSTVSLRGRPTRVSSKPPPPPVPLFSRYGRVTLDRLCLVQMDPIVLSWSAAVEGEERLTRKRQWLRGAGLAGSPPRHAGPGVSTTGSIHGTPPLRSASSKLHRPRRIPRVRPDRLRGERAHQ